jgi:hypothetical protein
MPTQPTWTESAATSSPRREKGQALVKDWRESGLKQSAYAKKVGIRPQRLSYWINRVGKLVVAAKVRPPDVRPKKKRKPGSKKPGGRFKFPDWMPKQVNVVDVPPEECVGPDGRPLVLLYTKRAFDLDFVPAHYVQVWNERPVA